MTRRPVPRRVVSPEDVRRLVPTEPFATALGNALTNTNTPRGTLADALGLSRDELGEMLAGTLQPSRSEYDIISGMLPEVLKANLPPRFAPERPKHEAPAQAAPSAAGAGGLLRPHVALVSELVGLSRDVRQAGLSARFARALTMAAEAGMTVEDLAQMFPV